MKADALATDELWRNPGLRIAVVTETYPPEVNGVAMTLGRMVEGLVSRGHRVQLIRPRQRGEVGAPGDDDIDELLTRGWKIPRYAGLNFGLPARRVLLAQWRRSRPDLVHVATEGPLGWSAVSAALKLGLPVTSDFHTNFDHYSGHYGMSWLRMPVAAYLKRFHNRTARTLVPTEAMAQMLAAQGYERLCVVARGVETVQFGPQKRDQALRQSWGADADAPVLLCVSRLAPEKNLLLVSRAFRAVLAEHPRARCVFVGDGPMRARLEREFPEAIFAGMRRDEDLARHYASADIFLFASLTETFGNVTLEAMASGLCVVAYDQAAAAEAIRDGEHGLLVAPGDEDAFINSAVKLAGQPARWEALGGKARERALGFSWDAVNDCFAASLLQVWEQGLSVSGRIARPRESVA